MVGPQTLVNKVYGLTFLSQAPEHQTGAVYGTVSTPLCSTRAKESNGTKFELCSTRAKESNGTKFALLLWKVMPKKTYHFRIDLSLDWNLCCKHRLHFAHQSIH